MGKTPILRMPLHAPSPDEGSGTEASSLSARSSFFTLSRCSASIAARFRRIQRQREMLCPVAAFISPSPWSAFKFTQARSIIDGGARPQKMGEREPAGYLQKWPKLSCLRDCRILLPFPSRCHCLRLPVITSRTLVTFAPTKVYKNSAQAAASYMY